MNINDFTNLDKHVAEAIGCDIYNVDEHGVWINFPFQEPTLFRPSDNMGDAWYVVMALEEEEVMVFIHHTIEQGKMIGFEVEFFDYNHDGKSTLEFDENLELAICRAGIRMMEYIDGGREND